MTQNESATSTTTFGFPDPADWDYQRWPSGYVDIETTQGTIRVPRNSHEHMLSMRLDMLGRWATAMRYVWSDDPDAIAMIELLLVWLRQRIDLRLRNGDEPCTFLPGCGVTGWHINHRVQPNPETGVLQP
jgi:hypothetical protein